MKKRKSLTVKIFILAFTVYSVFTVTDIQLKINKEQSDRDALAKEMQDKTVELCRLDDMLENFPDDDYFAQEARGKLSYGTRDEKIYRDVGGR